VLNNNIIRVTRQFLRPAADFGIIKPDEFEEIISTLRQSMAQAPELPRLIDAKTAGKMLSMTPVTLSKYVESGDLKEYTIKSPEGGRLWKRFLLSDVLAFCGVSGNVPQRYVPSNSVDGKNNKNERKEQ